MNSNTSNQALDLSGFGTKVEPAAKPVAAPVAMDFSSFGTRVDDAGSDAEDKGFLGRRVDDARRGWNRAMQSKDVMDVDRRSETARALDQIDAGTYEEPTERWQRLSENPRAKQYRNAGEAGRQQIRSTLEERIGEDVADIVGAEQAIQNLPQSAEVQKFNQAEDFSGAWDALAAAPVEVITSLATESLGQQAPFLPLMAISPALGAGAGSYIVENSSDIMNSLREAGVDFTNEDSIRAGLSDPERMAAFREHASRRGLAIGLVDAISGGLAGKFAAGAKSTLGKIGRGATEDLVMQPALGAVGEAAGALAAGDEISAKDMLAEAAGEIGPGAVETAVGTYRNSRAAGIDDTEVTPGTAEAEQIPAETLMLTGPDQSVPQLPSPETVYGDDFTMTSTEPGTADTGPAALPSPDQYGRAYGEGFVAGNDLPTPSPGPDYVAMVDRTGNQIGWFNPNTAHAVGKDLGSFEAPRRSTPSINDLLSDGRSADEIRAELVAQRQDERKNSDVGSVVRVKLGGQKRAQDVRVVGFTPDGAIVETRDGATVPVDTNQIPVPEQLNLDLAPAQEMQRQRITAEIERAAMQTETPTEAQAEAGNYRKGHVKVNGLDIAIETPRGTQRTGTDPNGRAWSVEMPAHYGYIKRTTGADGDHVDVYVGPEPDSDQVFVIDQIDHNTGKFDEHKVMVGYPSSASAQADYRKAFSDGRAMLRLGAITPMSMSDFKVWIKDGNTRKPLAFKASDSKVGTQIGNDQISPGKVEAEPKSTLKNPSDYVSLWGDLSKKFLDLTNFQSRIDAAHEWLLKKDRETGHEHIVVMNHDGSLIAAGTSNSETYVNVSGAAQEAFLVDGNKAVITHNHPKSHSAHSLVDITILGYPGLDQVQVVNATGAIFDAHLGEEGKRLTKNAKVAKAYTIPIQRISKDVAIAISEILVEHIAKGTLSKARADYLYGTILSNTIHRLAVIDFTSNEKGRIDISDIDGLADQLDQTVRLYGDHYKLKTRENSNAILDRSTKPVRLQREMDDVRGGDERTINGRSGSSGSTESNRRLEGEPAVDDSVTGSRNGDERFSFRQHPARLVEVNGTELGEWKTVGQLRRKAAKHLGDLRGTTIKNADTGLELRITDRGIKHTLSGAGPELLQAVGKIKDIIRVATLVVTEADKRGRPEIKAVHKFETDININDQKFIAHVTGYETTDGAIFYDLALGKRGKGASASGTEIKDQVRNRITGQTPRSDNVIPDRSEIQSEKRRTLEAAVVTEIKRLAPAANIQTRETGQTLVGGKWAEGGYIPVDDLIWTAMDAANPEHVARHEVIHHLRATGRITETEWNTLQRKAQTTWRDQYRVDEYRDQYKGTPDIETVLDEEAVAEAFADWVDGSAEAKGGIARIFRKIRDFFDRIAAVVRGQGYQTAEDVFRSIDEGEVGKRAARSMDQMKQQRTEYFAIAGSGKRKAAATTGTKPQQKPSPLTKEQEAAIKRTMANIEDEAPVGVRIRETISDSVDYLKRGAVQHIFDQFDSIKRYEKATYGDLKRASMSAYKMARLTTNLQSTMAAVLRHGPLEYKNGAFQVRKGFDGGFEAIFADLADRGLLKAWKGWAVANRAKRLAAEGRENNMTTRDIALLKDLDKQYPEFREVLKRWTEFNGAMLDMAEQTGLLDPDARALFESDDYVPFYRAMDDRPTGPFNKRGIANQRSGINRLRGGEAEVNDLIDNMVRNMTHLVDASMKNVAAKRVLKTIKTAGLDDGSVIMKVPHDAVPISVTPEEAARALEDIGVQVQGMTKQQHDQWLKLFTLRPPKDPDVVSVMVGGKPQYFRVNDPLLLASMTSLGTERVHWLVSILGMPKRWLTTGVTATPGFMLRNFIRDSLHGWVVSGENFTPGIDGFKGAIRSYREDTALVSIMAAGGGSGGFFRTQSRDVAKMLSKTKGKATVIDSPKMAWEWWKRVGQATENANRLAIYDSVLKDTGDTAEAAFQALDIMDFSMRGDSAVIRFLIGTIPFLNARMQGLYRLGRGAKENPKAFMLRGGLITAATMLLYGLNADDDRYDELPEWEKDAYYHIFLDNIFPDSALEAAGIDAKEWHIRMPKPFEVGALFSTIPERVTRLAQGKDDIGKYGERMWSMMRDTFAVDMPQFIKPLMEQWANETTFTGSPIVPERMKDLKPEAQYDARTSELAKQIGDALPDFMGDAKSPKRIDAAVRAYFGSYGVYVMGIADEVLDPIVDNPVEPELRGDQLPELGSFVRQQPYMSTRFVSEFYGMKSEIEALAKTYKQYRSQGQVNDAKELLERDSKKIAMAGWMRRKANQMSGINKDIRAIEESRSMTAAQKRERIDQLADQRNEFAKQVVTQLNKAGIK